MCAQDQTPVFKAGSALVRVDVEVLEKGRLVTGLTAQDFVVTDEGRPQAVQFVDRDKAPLQLLLVLDVSGSMRKYVAEMGAAAQEALAALDAGDEVGIETFGGDAHLLLEMTPDRRAAAVLLHSAAIDPERKAGTVIYGALLEAARIFREQGKAAARHAILILTDNGSLSYKVTDEDVLRALSGASIVLDAIVPPGTKPPQFKSANTDFTPHNIFRIAAETGGEVVPADKTAQRFRELLEHIRSRYSLQYKAPPSEPGVFRHIQVELSADARRLHPRATVQARSGYYAAAE